MPNISSYGSASNKKKKRTPTTEKQMRQQKAQNGMGPRRGPNMKPKLTEQEKKKVAMNRAAKKRK